MSLSYKMALHLNSCRPTGCRTSTPYLFNELALLSLEAAQNAAGGDYIPFQTVVVLWDILVTPMVTVSGATMVYVVAETDPLGPSVADVETWETSLMRMMGRTTLVVVTAQHAESEMMDAGNVCYQRQERQGIQLLLVSGTCLCFFCFILTYTTSHHI